MLAQKSQVFHKAVDELLFVSADEKLRFEYDQRLKSELLFFYTGKSFKGQTGGQTRYC